MKDDEIDAYEREATKREAQKVADELGTFLRPTDDEHRAKLKARLREELHGPPEGGPCRNPRLHTAIGKLLVDDVRRSAAPAQVSHASSDDTPVLREGVSVEVGAVTDADVEHAIRAEPRYIAAGAIPGGALVRETGVPGEVEAIASVVVRRHGDDVQVEMVPGDLSGGTKAPIALADGESTEAFATRVRREVEDEIQRAKRVQFAGTVHPDVMIALLREAQARKVNAARFMEQCLTLGVALLSVTPCLSIYDDRITGPFMGMLAVRGIDTPCSACGGSGIRTYGTTATYRRAPGGMAITSDVCDQCWGSGEHDKPWPARSDR